MEQAKHGIAFSSGMAAITAVFMTLNKDDHILSIDDVYGGTNRLMNKILKRFGLENSMVDFTDINNIEKHIKKNTKMITFETPTNPLLKIVDI